MERSLPTTDLKKKSTTFLFTVTTALFLFLSASPAMPACRQTDVAGGLISPAHAARPDALIEYFGHNFFQITTPKGTKIITDPLAPGMYPTPDVSPDVITIGREHPNHNYVELARGKPVILRGLRQDGADWNRISTNIKDVYIYNVPVYQNGREGALKGAAFVFDLGALCIAHLGDLSHTLTPRQIKQIGKVDVALIPIGGIYTMPPRTAREVLEQIKPKIAIPMHYRDNFYILKSFVEGLPTRQMEGDTLVVRQYSLPAAMQIIILRPKGGREYW